MNSASRSGRAMSTAHDLAGRSAAELSVPKMVRRHAPIDLHPARRRGGSDS